MPIYKVTYRSLTATYGPSFISAKDEDEARRKFARSAFTAREMSLIVAVKVSDDEITKKLSDGD